MAWQELYGLCHCWQKRIPLRFESMKPALALAAQRRTVVFLAAPDTQILDVTGPFQIFVRASELFLQEHPGAKAPYRVLLASTSSSATISTNCGISLRGHLTYRAIRSDVDTLLVAGGSG
jgi:transcriptional regulator GlxA family with amidase domain